MYIFPPYFILPFVGSLLFLLCLDRFFHAILLLIIPSDASEKKLMRCEIFLGHCLEFLVHIVCSFIWFLLRVFLALGSMLWWVLLIIIVLSFLYVSYEQFPEVWLGFFSYYNRSVSPTIRGWVIIPLQFLNVPYKCIVPIYNIVIWFAKVVFNQGIMSIIIAEMNTVMRMGAASTMLIQHFIESVREYLSTLDCSDQHCLQTQPFPMDILTPWQDLRNLGVMVIDFGRNVCGLMQVPIQLVLFPVLDPVFGESVHNFWNAFLQIAVNIPITTYTRCGTNLNNVFLMCTPDMNPLWTYLFAGWSCLGQGLDHWLQYVLWIIQPGINPSSSSCFGVIPTIHSQSLGMGLLSGRVVLSRVRTDWSAMANGSMVIFTKDFGMTSNTVKLWPLTIDPSFGIASVYYSQDDHAPSALLGCNCTDTTNHQGPLVRCGLVSLDYDLNVSDSLTELVFEDTTWSPSFQCKYLEISVKSVRFPVKRYENSEVSGTGDCIRRGDCENVDATVWVVPKCSQLNRVSAACNPSAIGTSCYPFCMGTRVRGTGNMQMVLTNAEKWRYGKQLLYQDCLTNAPQKSFGYQITPNTLSMSLKEQLASLQPVSSSQQQSTGLCKRGVTTVSFVVNQTNSSSQTVSPFIRSGEQPFVISGETIFTAETLPDGRGVVHVERVTGDQVNVYSLRQTPWDIEAAPRMNLPIEEFDYNPLRQIYVPIEMQARRIYAVSSVNYLFYAQSPNLELFGAYFDYCRDDSLLPKFQFMIYSSYAPMRIYRVRAYCLGNCIDVVSQITLDSFAGKAITDRDFVCTKRFNASIVGLEYIDTHNIAVVVQEADSTYDAYTDSGTGSIYQVYWLHPETMQLRSPIEGPWVSVEANTQKILSCLVTVTPRPPAWGTLVTLVVTIPLQFLRFGVDSIVYTPGVIQYWRKYGDVCPVDHLGHSVLQTCAMTVYSLDDYFDQLDQANGIFWGSLDYLAELFTSQTVTVTTIAQLLQGLSIYGQATASFQNFHVNALLNTPLMDEMKGLLAMIRSSGNSVTGGIQQIANAGNGWARFSYLAFHRVGVDTFRAVLTTPDMMDAKQLWHIFSFGVYDLQPEFENVVGSRLQSACEGVKIMFGGGDSPWAKTVYHLCLSNTQITMSLMHMFGTMLVEVPLVKCACVDSAGVDMQVYVLQYCIPMAPDSLKAKLLQMMQYPDQCQAVTKFLQTNLENMFQRYYAELYQSLEAVGDSVDYALIGFDKNAGECSDFSTNPNVVVIMPEPVDYFQQCSTTVMCHTKCSGTWNIFQSVRQQYQDKDLVNTVAIDWTVESLFFPYPVADIVALGKVLAMSELDTCETVCTADTDQIQCIAVAFLKTGTSTVLFRFFCIPSNPVESVTLSTLNPGSSLTIGGTQTIERAGFLDNQGMKLAVKVATGQVLVLDSVKKSITVLVDIQVYENLAVIPLILRGLRPMQLKDMLVVQDKVLLALGVRVKKDNGEYSVSQSCLWVDSGSGQSGVCDISEDLWRGFQVTEFPLHNTGEKTATLLMHGATSTQVLRLSWDDFLHLQVMNVQILSQQIKNSQGYIFSKRFRIDVEKSLWNVFLSDPNVVYDWLKQMRMKYTGNGNALQSASFYQSQPVSAQITLQTGCDGLDCRGCPTLALRSLCTAYQSCAVFQCVGTPVNLNRPLCGLGKTLKTFGEMTFQSTQGAYSIFVQVFMVILKLSTQKQGVRETTMLTFPDESFFGYVCTAKDSTAHLVSVLTSTVNSVIQLSQTGGPALQKLSAIDPKAHVSLSLSTAALTAFFHQILLAPIYSLTVGRTIMLCQVQGMIALFTVSKTKSYSVDIMSPRLSNATASMAGMCLTQNAVTQALQTGDARIRGLFANSAGQFITNAAQAYVRMKIEPAMHTLDGVLSYVSGVLYKFGDVLRGFNLKSCLLPNVMASKTVECACGDTEMAIPSVQAQQGLEKKAHWCVGVLYMTQSDGSVKPVYNPYTFSKLRELLPRQSLQKYLDCVETSNDCLAPNDPVFSKQGSNLLQVMGKCQHNYANKQWDSAAFMMYDKDLFAQQVGVSGVTVLPQDMIGMCLLKSAANGITNQACVDMYMLPVDFWQYTPRGVLDSLDGCVVFSGPAVTNTKFKDCLHEYNTLDQCELDGHLWTPASNNTVPVAQLHIINQTKDKTLWVQQQYQLARELVGPILADLQNFHDPDLSVGFFSAEGDFIHQIMDCIYLGPYAKMDYWPLDNDGSLHGPSWSRDETDGKTRQVDPKTCPKPSTLPFTCGSITRKSMIKFFINQVLLQGRNGNDVMNELIRRWVKDLITTWNNMTEYESSDSNTFLPKHLQGDTYMYLNTSSVLVMIEQQLEYFWNLSRFQNSPWTLYLNDFDIHYNYSEWEQGPQVAQDARFDTTIPLTDYDGNTSGMKPPLSDWNTSLWQNCHGALRQVMFTIPVYAQNGSLKDTTVPDFPGGGPEQIEKHIEKILASAKESSPLYRLYNPFHKPSRGVNCLATETQSSTSIGAIRFSDFSMGGYKFLDGASITPVNWLGIHYGLLGKSLFACFCGWGKNSDGKCVPDQIACGDIQANTSLLCPFYPSDQNVSLLMSLYDPLRWSCPELELSEHFGFLDRDAIESWVANLGGTMTTSADTLLRHGPGGIRIGNLDSSSNVLNVSESMPLKEAWKRNVFPSSRQVDPKLGIVYGCNAGEEDFLFPMAQGIHDSPVQASCLRYALEYAQYLVTNDTVEKSKQQGIMKTWKRRCGTQIQLIGLCQSMDMYQPNQFTNTYCPYGFQLDTSSSLDYITPECLVKYHDRFYDPCVCDTSLCVFGKILNTSWLETSCPTVFDPRSVIQTQELGWWEENSNLKTSHNTWLKEHTNRIDFARFLEKPVEMNTDSDWQTTEGVYTSRYCDLISDYWGDQAYFPVGYHVTMPCMHEDIGYRSFDNVFAMDDRGNMIYMEDQTRDADLIGAHFGAGGLCRSTTFGYDMSETNTMRICTRTQGNENTDIYTPKKDSSSNPPLQNYQCSMSSTDVPWSQHPDFIQYYDASLVSVGTVPNLPTSGDVYPQTSHFFGIGGSQSMEWGNSCEDFQIPDCFSNTDCPTGYTCRRNICVHNVVQCLGHEDCAGNQMCSGLGQCLDPVISVWNNMNETVEFRIHTDSCAATDTSFSMQGASLWAYVPDLMEAHGMCSYRHWREYLYTLNNGNCACGSNPNDIGQSCLLQAENCTLYNFMLPANPVTWWMKESSDPSRLKMIPTSCDRDYERLSLNGSEMKICVPSQPVFVSPSGSTTTDGKTRSTLFQTYMPTKQIPLALMPYRTNVTYGLLGNNPSVLGCGAVKQCYADDFYVNGVLQMRTRSDGITIPNRTLSTGALYDGSDIFRCGVIGYFDGTQCRIDEKLFPLYSLLCKQTLPSDCMNAMDMTIRGSVCASIQNPYPPSFSVLNDVNVVNLGKLFQLFTKPTSLSQHLYLTECAVYLYQAINTSKAFYSSKTLYYPFAFTVYEFPFAWFYQCMIETQVQVDATRSLQQCVFFDNRISFTQYTLLTNMDPFHVFVSRITGGYRKNDVVLYIQKYQNLTKQYWKQSVSAVRAQWFATNRRVIPYCNTTRKWELDNVDDVTRFMIYMNLFTVCDTVTSQHLKDRYNVLHPDHLIESVNDEIPQLTRLSNVQPQSQDIVLDLLEQVEKWGVEYIATVTDGLDQFAQSIAKPDVPVSFQVSMPVFGDTSVQNKLLLDVQAPKYQPNSQDISVRMVVCPDNETVSLFPTTTDPTLKSVKICKTFDTGLFQCGYPNYATGNSYTYRETQVGGSITNYLEGLYTEVKKKFDTLLSNNPIPKLAPTSLPFFEDITGKPFTFDLTKVKTYQNNINPDPNVPIMCVLGMNNVNFTQCTNPHYKTIQRHVQKNYMKDGPVAIPFFQQMDWPRLSKAIFTKGSLYSYASTTRDDNRQHLRTWMNDEKVCNGDNVNINDRMCQYLDAGKGAVLGNFQVISPWTLGYWNPGEKCDVDRTNILSGYQEVINVYCYLNSYCPNLANGNPDFTNDYYASMPFQQDCRAKQNKQAQFMNVRDDIPYNLCRGNKFEEDTVCLHNQGMLGGTDGKPTQDQTSLYNLLNLTDLPFGWDQGYLQNPLFQQQPVDYGFFRMHPKHMGGHHIGLKIERKNENTSIGTMFVFKMPLQSIFPPHQFMQKWETLTIDQWIPSLQKNWQSDHDLYNIYSIDRHLQGKYGWDCPIRRRAFYAGTNAKFHPWLPSAQRNRKMFGGIMTNAQENDWAHPTQAASDARGHLGKYITSNGFCFCPITEDVPDNLCSVSFLESGHNCSLQNTIMAIQGKQWGWSHTFLPRTKQNTYKVCTLQMDWPFVQGVLRDNTTVNTGDAWKNHASDPETQRCHLLDRLEDFQYSYVSVNQIRKAGFNTLDRGVCHMGRIQKILTQNGRCVRKQKNADNVFIVCDNKNYTVDRLASKTPEQMLYRAKWSHRQRCNQCTSLPLFKTRQGQIIDPPESSFGLAYRKSAEKVIQKDIQKAICKGLNETECKGQVLNESAWSTGKFLDTLLKSPRNLFQNPPFTLPTTTILTSSLPPNTSSLWNENPWVYCPSPTSLATGEKCLGTIDRASWSQNRVGTCYASIKTIMRGQPDPMAQTTICDVSKKLSKLCNAIEQAKKIIQSANCIHAGDPRCALQEFIYHPSSWDTSNHAFVHQTVMEYYERVNGSVCPLDYTTQELIKKNGETLLQCPATAVYTAYLLVDSLRNMADQICDVVFRLVGVFSNLLLSIYGSTNMGMYKDQFIATWQELVRAYNGLFSSFSDVFMDTVMFNGVIGVWIQRAIQGICFQINSLLRYLHGVYCKMIVVYLPQFFASFKNIATYIDSGFTVLNDFIDVILKNFLPEAFLSLTARGYHGMYQSDMFKRKQTAYQKASETAMDTSKPAQTKTLSAAQRQAKTAAQATEKKALGNLAGSSFDDVTKNGNAKTVSKTGKFVGALGTGGAILDMGAQGWLLYNDMQTMATIAKAMEDFPAFWTLFDFTTIQVVVDDIASFFAEDVFCFAYQDVDLTNSSYEFLPCTWLRVPTASSDMVSNLLPYATQCWADAQVVQDISQSNYYACSATSVCCTDAFCTERVMCIQCPLASSSMETTYGCNTMIQRCQCSVPKTEITKCLTHKECTLTGMCSLLTGLTEEVSYGNIPCSECSTQAICLSGKCVCLANTNTDSSVLAMCKNPFGERLAPRAQLLCGYEPLSNELLTQYYWNDIAYAKCSQVQGPVCVQIITDTSHSFYLALSNSLQSQTTRRRLLFEPTFIVNKTQKSFRGRRLTGFIEDTQNYLDQSPIIQKLRFPLIEPQKILSMDAVRLSTLWNSETFAYPQWTGTCTPVQVIFYAGRQSIEKVGFYYLYAFTAEPRKLDTHWLAGVPNFQSSSNNVSKKTYEITGNTLWTDIVFYSTLNFFRIDVNDIMHFFQTNQYAPNEFTLGYVVDTMTHCDLDSVLFCDKQSRSLLPATIFILVMYFVVSTISSALGMGFIANLYLLFIFWLILYHTYTIAPGCWPMLPTCYGDQIIEGWQSLFPETIGFPEILQCVPSSSTCVRSCTEFGFVGYLDPIAFMAADLGVDGFIQDYIPMEKMRGLVQDEANITGYRLCAAVSSVLSLPVVIAVVGIVYVAISFVIFFLSILPKFMSLLWQTTRLQKV